MPVAHGPSTSTSAWSRCSSDCDRLHDLRALKTLAASLTAVGRGPEAQDLMIYRVRVAEKAYGEGDPKVVPSMCDLGDWFAEVGKAPEARMTFGVALNIVTSKRSSNDLLIVEPLRGIARTYMRRQSYPEVWLYPPSPPGCSAPGQECLPPFRMDSGGKRIVLPRKLVYYPTPEIVAHIPTVPPEEVRSHYVQVEFTVAADGSVSNGRIVEHDTRDRYAQDVLDAVEASRFRPKFVDEQAVATTAVRYRETFRTGKPKT